MNESTRSGIAIVLVVVLLAAMGYVGLDSGRRRLAMLPMLLVTTDFPEPLTRDAEAPDTEWFDEYYTLTRIDDQTIAIGEPLYHAQNYNYLILGRERAILFDSGAGLHDIRPVVASLTKLPVTAVPSHLHYDHVGSHVHYERLALIDLPDLRARAGDGRLSLGYAEHLGFLEGIGRPTLEVTEWLAPGAEVDLGGRVLEVLHTPGHTRDSMALLDRERGQLFSGDFITEGPVFYFLPGSSVGDALRTAEMLLSRMDEGGRLLTAHRFDPPGLPTLARADLEDLRDSLRRMKNGELDGKGWWPREYPVNDRLWLLADFQWAQRWD